MFVTKQPLPTGTCNVKAQVQKVGEPGCESRWWGEMHWEKELITNCPQPPKSATRDGWGQKGKKRKERQVKQQHEGLCQGRHRHEEEGKAGGRSTLQCAMVVGWGCVAGTIKDAVQGGV